MRSDKKLKQIISELNDSEKFGVKFGLFPIRIEAYNLDTKEIVRLMELAE